MHYSSFGVVWVLAPLVLASCANVSNLYHDTHADTGTGGTSTTGEGGDLFTGTGGTGGTALQCTSDCVHVHSSAFQGPTMMWIGPTADAPPCPEIAPFIGFEGFADLHVTPHTCPACTCSPASCVLPEAMHASAAKCPGDGAASLPFDAPAAWEGTCTAESAIAAGLVCSGVACVQSLTIDAPSVAPCQPVTQGNPQIPAPSWGRTARECLITLSDTCPIEGDLCAPTPPDGFALCVYREGADPDDPLNECPKDYPDSFVVYAGAIDSRACAPCTCGEAEGTDCAALVSVFSGGACGALLGSHMVTNATEDTCFDLPPGVGLESKSAVWVVDEAASCAPGGGNPAGEIQAGGAMTYCCQPGLVPPE